MWLTFLRPPFAGIDRRGAAVAGLLGLLVCYSLWQALFFRAGAAGLAGVVLGDAAFDNLLRGALTALLALGLACVEVPWACARAGLHLQMTLLVWFVAVLGASALLMFVVLSVPDLPILFFCNLS
jgi:hypothetical protein